MTESYEGGCLCGAIRYRVTGKPTGGNVCTCTQCQKHTGAPLPAFVDYPLDRFALLQGAPARYRASDFATREFCAACGSSLFWRRDGADRLDVFLGTLDEPPRMPPPRVWIHARHRVSWLPDLPGVPTFAEDRASG